MLKSRKYEPPLAHKATCEYRDSDGARPCSCSRKPGCSQCKKDLIHDFCKDHPNMSYLACCPTDTEAWSAIEEAARKQFGKRLIMGTSSFLCPCKCGKTIYESSMSIQQVKDC